MSLSTCTRILRLRLRMTMRTGRQSRNADFKNCGEAATTTLGPKGRQTLEPSSPIGHQGGCMVFAAKGGIKKWRPKGRRTSPAGTVSQPIGKPFYGQAKGLLWLTWRSYAGPPQYYITPEGESPQPACKAKPITGRTLGAQGQRPGGAINPRPRKRASTFGNTGKHNPLSLLSPQAPEGLVHIPSGSLTL